MKQAPEPLVDEDVDLRDFPFMPIDITRLFGSDFNAVSDDATWRAGVTLWLKSYHQVPAASVSGNDLALARLCETTPDKWAKIKKGALRGWVKCRDGRYYHPVVAEKALEGWIEKLAQRKASAAGNAKRHSNPFDPKPYDDPINRAKEQLARLNPRSRTLAKRHTKYQTIPTGSQPAPGGSEPGADRERDGGPDRLPLVSQGTGKGQGREEITESISLSGGAPPARDEREIAYARFEGAYPEISLPDEARRALYEKLDDGIAIDEIVDGAQRYAETCASGKREGQFIKAAHNWLRGGGWKSVGKRKVEHKTPNDKTLIRRGDPRWPALARMYMAEKRKSSGPPADSWYFPNTWIEKITEDVEA